MYSNRKKTMEIDLCENVRRLSSFELNYWGKKAFLQENGFPNAQ